MKSSQLHQIPEEDFQPPPAMTTMKSQSTTDYYGTGTSNSIRQIQVNPFVAPSKVTLKKKSAGEVVFRGFYRGVLITIRKTVQ